ncbi:entericidin B [Xanthomonas arboricola pv. pruni MAFF 301427]|nr:entericidin B [Xanthomonas arboricola pv. pruni MAFF 301427]
MFDLIDLRQAAALPTKESVMKRAIVLLVLSVLSVGMLSGCNTVAGAGKDVQGAGEKVEDAARK